MADLYHWVTGDLAVSPTGDLLTVTGDTHVQQRILRRLLTVPSSYIWQLDYGAGLDVYVGQILNLAGIEGVIRAQLTLEASVAQTPPPSVLVSPISNGVVVQIKYVDAVTNAPIVLAFDVSP